MTPSSVADLEAVAVGHRNAPGQLWADLNAALRDELRLRLLARRSALHANGFVKVVLDPEASPRVGLHVWPPGAREYLVSPHGHRWDFASWIITGSLRETTYVEAPQGRPLRTPVVECLVERTTA
jgi:hypothetical protein